MSGIGVTKKPRLQKIKTSLFRFSLPRKNISRSVTRLALAAIYVVAAVGFPLFQPQHAEAAIAFRSAATNTSDSGPAINVAKPTGTVSGDVMIASIRGGDSAGAATTGEAGWVLIDTATITSRFITTWYKVAGGSEPSQYTFTINSGSQIGGGGIMSFSGVDNSAPIDNNGASESSNTGTGTSTSTTAFNTVLANTMIAAVFFCGAGTAMATASGMTEQYDITAGDGGAFRMSGDTVAQAAAGSTGSKTATCTSGTTWATYMVALSPPRPGLDQSAYRFLSNLDANNSDFIVDNITATDDTIRGLATDSANGFMYIGGFDAAGTPNWQLQKRRLSDGSKDTSFTPSLPTGNVGGIAVDPGGNAVFVAGNNGGTGWRVEKRRMSDGALCTAGNCGTQFGSGGVLVNASTSHVPANGSLNSVDIDTVNGYIYVAGFDTSNGNTIRIGKYKTDTGALDNSFTQNGSSGGGTACTSVTGYVCNNVTNGDDRLRTISTDPQNGYIYAGGWDSNNGGDFEWHMEKRRMSDGALCTAGNCGTQFATAGIYVSDGSAANPDQLLAFQVDTPGNAIYLGGFDGAGSGTSDRWRIEKMRADNGALCTGAAGCTGGAFDTDGIITYDSGISGSDEQLLDLDLDDAGGYLYTTGQEGLTTAANLQWRIEKRNRSDGALVSTFGTSGVVNVNPSANADAPAWISVDLSRNLLYTSGGDRTLGASNQQWRIQKFDLDYGGFWLSTPQDTEALASTNSSFRLRLLLHANTNPLEIGGESLKLQFAPKVGTCDTGFVNEVYQDVTTSSNEIRYQDNPSLADGVTLAAGLTGDPAHSGHSTIRQTIEETNPFTSVASVATGQDGMWDFAMKDFSAFGAYCFRVTYNDATPTLLTGIGSGSYLVVPEINFCRNTPTTDALLRSGTYFCSGTKRAFFWAQ